uniref:Protein FAR1-RELATED SEQUENCE n=1 Tax=Fagus sylvatica TaxID=28930 RepID=A0A2N9IAT0_FAGSY
MKWLAKLYEERERWVPAFLNSNFFAGMSSTQHSESMNAFFDGYLHSSTTLKGCILKELVRGGDEVKYKIEDEACSGKLFEVRFSSSECLERVTVLPDRYILDRWRKDIKRKHTYVSTCTDDVQHNPVLERYEKLHRLAVGVLEIGAESVENFNRKGRPRTKRLKSSMEEAVSKPKKKRNTAARNLAHSTSTTGVGGSAYGDGSTSNMSMSQSQAHGNEDQALNLT